MALFGTAAASNSKNLVEFRSGKMKLSGTTVTADKRKGKVYIYQSDDCLMHFCWQDRSTGNVEDDLIIFPDDIEFKKVPQCTTGRAFVLKFKSSSRKFFFWMQEPKDDKDEEYCKKVNELLNNPPAPGSSNTTSGSGGLASLQPALASLGDQLGDSSLQSLLNNMDQNQLMQLLGMTGLGGGFGDTDDVRPSSRTAAATTARSTAATTNSSTPSASTQPASFTPSATSDPVKSSKPQSAAVTSAVQLSDLQSILSNMQVPVKQENVDLSASFSTEALLPLLKDKDVQKRLKPFLPAVEDLPDTENGIKETLQSPQFKQSLTVFSAALCSGQLAPLMQQFQLPKTAIDAAAKGDVVAFTKALQEAESSKKDNEEDMALD